MNNLLISFVFYPLNLFGYTQYNTSYVEKAAMKYFSDHYRLDLLSDERYETDQKIFIMNIVESTRCINHFRKFGRDRDPADILFHFYNSLETISYISNK